MRENKGTKSKPVKIVSQPKSFNKLLLPVIILLTVFAFHSSLNNGFTSWDDEANVTKNPELLKYHADSLGVALKNVVAINKDIAMYSPMVKLSYLVEYAEFKFDAGPYHVLNLLLHLLNVMVVFYFVWLLCRHQWVAFITALLFAIHPMHVESVAWVTGRIDELYSFFYIAALCTYIKYLTSEKWKWQFYAITLGLFVLALFSKASAVTLPVVFFVMDYFYDRKITVKTILPKVPFFVLSLVFGYIAIYVQKSVLIREDIAGYNVLDWTLFFCYALTTYLWKLIAPIDLNCLYDYPIKHTSQIFSGAKMYPVIFYLSPFIVIAMGYLLYQSRKFGKDVLFGFGFFFFNIALVLPGFAARHAIIADRYTYVSYIGLFFILARWLTGLWENKYPRYEWLKTPSMVVSAVLLLWWGLLTSARCEVWHDSITLWSDAIEHSANMELIGSNSGEVDMGSGKKGFDSTVLRMPAEAYYNRGSAYLAIGKNNEAIQDFNIVVQLKPDFAEAYYNYGNAELGLGKNDEAIKEYNSAIRFKPDFAEAFGNRGCSYASTKRDEQALSDFNTAIRLKPTYADAYSNRGNYYYMHRQFDQAIKDYSAAILLKPDYAQAYNNRGVTYLDSQNFELALDDMKKARQLGYNVDPSLINKIESKIGGGVK